VGATPHGHEQHDEERIEQRSHFDATVGHDTSIVTIAL
jgi:hypothetical protein